MQNVKDTLDQPHCAGAQEASLIPSGTAWLGQGPRVLSAEAYLLLALGAIALLVVCVVLTILLLRAPGASVSKAELVGFAPALVLGKANEARDAAKGRYVLVEFGDYECPPCIANHSEVSSLLRRYPADLRFVFRHCPLPSHPNARSAAIAAEAARLQGRFWAMHDALMGMDGDIGGPQIAKAARRLGVNMTRFSKDGDEHAAKPVDSDLEDARTLGVRATPSFYLCCPGDRVYRLPSLAYVAAVMEEAR